MLLRKSPDMCYRLQMEVHIAKGAWWSISVPIVWINRRKLRTCEVYDCDQCDEKTKTLESMKKHIVESHEKYLDYNVLMHVKLSTEDFSEIKKKPYYYKDV